MHMIYSTVVAEPCASGAPYRPSPPATPPARMCMHACMHAACMHTLRAMVINIKASPDASPSPSWAAHRDYSEMALCHACQSQCMLLLCNLPQCDQVRSTLAVQKALGPSLIQFTDMRHHSSTAASEMIGFSTIADHPQSEE